MPSENHRDAKFDGLRIPLKQTRTTAILMKQGEISEADWVDIVNDQLERMSKPKAGLREYPLRPLKEFEAFILDKLNLTYEPPYHPFHAFGLKQQGDFGLGLTTRGIFFATSANLNRDAIPRRGHLYIFGLDKNVRWILAKADFRDDWGYKTNIKRKFTAINIKRSTLEEVMSKTEYTAEMIWECLGEAVEEYEKFRREKYQPAQVLLTQRRAEEEILESRRLSRSDLFERTTMLDTDEKIEAFTEVTKEDCDGHLRVPSILLFKLMEDITTHYLVNQPNNERTLPIMIDANAVKFCGCAKPKTRLRTNIEVHPAAGDLIEVHAIITDYKFGHFVSEATMIFQMKKLAG